MTDNVVQPGLLLQQAKAGGLTKRLAEIIKSQGTPAATPYAKMRLGYVMSFDPAAWTVTAVIGDLLTTIPNIPVLGGVLPAIEAPGMFMQTGGDRTTEYTLIGTLPKDPSTPTYGQMWRIRKTANQSVSNSIAIQTDTDLKFYGQAGRTYLFEILAIASKTGTEVLMDMVLGWTMPSGTTWSGGGPGPAVALGASTDAGQSTAAGANWRALSNAVGTLPYGVDQGDAISGLGKAVSVMFCGSLKMGATSGVCSVVWGQKTAPGAGVGLTIQEGSYLKVDMTSEYTL